MFATLVDCGLDVLFGDLDGLEDRPLGGAEGLGAVRGEAIREASLRAITGPNQHARWHPRRTQPYEKILSRSIVVRWSSGCQAPRLYDRFERTLDVRYLTSDGCGCMSAAGEAVTTNSPCLFGYGQTHSIMDGCAAERTPTECKETLSHVDAHGITNAMGGGTTPCAAGQLAKAGPDTGKSGASGRE